VKPEHAHFLLKKIDLPSTCNDAESIEEQDQGAQTACGPTLQDVPDINSLRPGCHVIVREDFEVASKMMGYLFGSTLGSSTIQKGAKGVVEELDASGDLVVSFDGSWGRSSVPKNKLHCLEVDLAEKEMTSAKTMGPSMWMQRFVSVSDAIDSLGVPKLFVQAPSADLSDRDGESPDATAITSGQSIGGARSALLLPPKGSATLGNASSSPTASPRSLGGSPRAPPEDLSSEPYDRTQQRILFIGAGMESNAPQLQVVMNAGFSVNVVANLPNPEAPNFPMYQFLPMVKQAIDAYQPHAIACASLGGAYMMALWQSGLWSGPSLVINRHPQLSGLPKDVPVIVCHGSNDEFYQYPREHLETFLRSGTPNRSMLFYTANSGLLGNGYTREGDRHNMASLLQYDCLPRLLDAAMCGRDPEMHLMNSWNGMVTKERLAAEQWLGFRPEELHRLWQSEEQRGFDETILFDVSPGTGEYMHIETLFRAQPAVPRAYTDMNPGMWQDLTMLKVERVENGMQEDGNASPYCRALERGIEAQGLRFRPGLHTRWAFHGSSAVEEIVFNPIAGFQPLMSGSRAAALWGPGTYFARDAKYVYDGGFCKVLPDGSKQMLLCMVMTGIPCLGDPTHRGVMPVRQGRHRYNCSVDSLSNPEIFVTQSPGAAYPAYVITFLSD